MEEIEKPNYYAIIPANIRYDKKLMPNAKLLFGEITALCNEKGFCWAGNEYFANLYKVSKETISRWISQLSRKGYVNIKIFYKKDSKEIDKRIISIVHIENQYPIDENVNTYYQKNQYPINEKVKENNTSINNKKEKEEKKKIVEFYENNITLIVSTVSEEIDSYLDDGLEAELIIACIKEAADRNKRNWKYIKTILNDCYNNKIYTVAQYEIKQKEFKQSNSKNQEIKIKETKGPLYKNNFSEYDKFSKGDKDG